VNRWLGTIFSIDEHSHRDNGDDISSGKSQQTLERKSVSKLLMVKLLAPLLRRTD
jgi:hypothetical protein